MNLIPLWPMNDSPVLWPLAILFFFIAFLYSSVGFGGGSSYIAILSLYIHNFLEIKTTALLCNLVVVAASSFLFIKKGYFDRKKILPMAACSIPAAFAGAIIHLSQQSFFILLGCLLILSGLLLVMQVFIKPVENSEIYKDKPLLNVALGSGIGFVSGLAGIGGGIFLSPVLNLIKWDTAKKIAASASFFILVNSIAGLAAQVYSHTFTAKGSSLFLLLTSVFVGAQVGTRMSLHWLKPHIVKGLTGILVTYIGLKLILKYTISVEI